MKAGELRETFLGFFEARDHLRVPSASLVPPTFDPSVLLTTAGMQPFKPYFRGEERPPHPRLTSCQKCFRTVDIDVVGTTLRHLTFFEMLGNFSVGDYFKQGAVEYALELSAEGFGFPFERIWITVFGGDEELGLGPDEEAIEAWRAVGVPEERIVPLGRADNFWQAGPTGPSGPCSELYLDRGPEFGGPDDRPGDDTERFLEYWNLVFMQYELHADGSLTPLPSRNIDTGLGLDRLAAIVQDKASVFETDQFRPLVGLGEELSGRTYGSDFAVTRALRILADHGRGMTFLLADGVVPSNEERGYVLRRIMRRAVQQGRSLGIEEPFLPLLADRVIEVMAPAYPELVAQAETIRRWAAAEEQGFGRTLTQGERLLGELVRQARESGRTTLPTEEVFRLHDTYGFPFEMTKELAGVQGLEVDGAAFVQRMEEARELSRSGAASPAAGVLGDVRERTAAFARSAGFSTRFTGYETTEQDTVLGALERENGRLLAKLPESPFYPAGGGQVSDSGVIETPHGVARVTDVVRLGDDQAVALELDRGELVTGESARARVDRTARLATARNHTATHLLHAALRLQLGTHVRQAGSYVGPDKLRFDFTHGERLSAEQVAAVETQVNDWIVAGHPVHAIETSREQAEAMGAMALFGEKYGDWVRMVEVEEVSRELCGGTHVASTAEIGLFQITAETSSAANVRRIEAVTGAASVAAFRAQRAELEAIADTLKVSERDVLAAVRRLTERPKAPASAAPAIDPRLGDRLVEHAHAVAGVPLVAAEVPAPDAKTLVELADRVRQRLGDAVVVLGTAIDGRAQLVVNVAPAVVERGVSAGAVVRAAAPAIGGGGGGRDTMAQAGGREPERLADAVAIARRTVEDALS